MKIVSAAILTLAAMIVPLASAEARTHRTKHRAHHHYARSYDRDPYEGRGYYGGYRGPVDPYGVPGYRRYGRVPVGTYGEPVPFRTVQPTDVGIGVLAPNGYRGPGTATGGPSGGLGTGGGR